MAWSIWLKPRKREEKSEFHINSLFLGWQTGHQIHVTTLCSYSHFPLCYNASWDNVQELKFWLYLLPGTLLHSKPVARLCLKRTATLLAHLTPSFSTQIHSLSLLAYLEYFIFHSKRGMICHTNYLLSNLISMSSNTWHCLTLVGLCSAGFMGALDHPKHLSQRLQWFCDSILWYFTHMSVSWAFFQFPL